MLLSKIKYLPISLISRTPHYLSIRSMSSKRALVVIAEGSEEIEAVTPIDILRRAGIEVSVAGLLNSNPVKCSNNVVILPDAPLSQLANKSKYDIVILPGGVKGSEAFCQSKEIGTLLREQEGAGRHIGAICAAPTALKEHGIFYGKKLTSYPSYQQNLEEGKNYDYKNERVVVDGNLITSRGPGTSIEFSLAIVEALVGKEKADEIGNGILLKK